MRRVDELTTFMSECLEIWEPQPPGTIRARTGIALTFVWYVEISVGVTPFILNLCSRRTSALCRGRSVREQQPWCALERRLCGYQRVSGYSGKYEKLLTRRESVT
jgi:hypothetical protein